MFRMLCYLILLLLLNYSISHAQNTKRGIAYGYHSPNDMEALSPQISWWYNWSVVPETNVANVYENYGFEFVPMAWNGAFNETALRQFLTAHPGVKYLLAFNEPNFIDQANMKPSEVAAQWPKLEAIANDFDLEIVGPAVNYCGNCVEENGTVYTSPFDYLDDFFAACPDCKVDYIAVHCYMNTLGALEWYIGEFKKYGKSIWLTEFAGWEPNGNINEPDDQINFMIGAVDFLDNEPDVFRYAWFIGRAGGINNYPYIDLLGTDGVLTELGEVYKHMPIHDENMIIDIPSRIEAENYNTMDGVTLERTTDQSGFLNVGYIDAGDWMEYKINVSQSDDYVIRFRIASTENSSLRVLVDGLNVLTQNFDNTGGWQNWVTFENNINLETGIHILRLQAMTDGLNINWLQIGDVASFIEKKEEKQQFFNIWPNPGDGLFNVQAGEEITQLQVFNPEGKKLLSLSLSGQLDLRGLPVGIYIIKAFDDKQKCKQTTKVAIIK